MNPANFLLLFCAFLAGAINSIAGGGTILTYPLLLSMGASPVIANATATAIIWPGGISSAIGYRKCLAKLPKKFYLLLLPAAVGGFIGAFLLGQTSNNQFSKIVPWLFSAGVVVLALQPKIQHWLYSQKPENRAHRHVTVLAIIGLLMFLLSIYGGYFGIGFGIMALALLGFTTLTDLNQMNGLKNIMAVVINVIATVYFVTAGLIDWRLVPFGVVGSIAGGIVGAKYSSKLPAKTARTVVVIIGIVVAVVLFIKR